MTIRIEIKNDDNRDHALVVVKKILMERRRGGEEARAKCREWQPSDGRASEGPSLTRAMSRDTFT